MIKLIASDVDGTLLRGGEDTPLPTALPELILRLKEKGIFFCGSQRTPVSQSAPGIRAGAG